MKRLYAKLYLAFVAVVFGCFVVAVLAASGFQDDRDLQEHFASLGELLVESLPPTADPGFHDALVGRARRLSVDVALWDARGELLAYTGDEHPPATAPRPGWFHARGRGGVAVRLRDGRVIAARRVGRSSRHAHFLWALGTFAAVLALGCYPIARRITRRLERLQAGMNAFAAGDLAARAPIQGRDEVAAVARSFNDAAARIEALVERQRGVLAAASHELRSPLARVRMAVELLGGEEEVDRAKLSSEAARDIEDLDALIGDLLEAARAQGPVRAMEDVDLRALLVEEAARAGASVTGDAVRVVGDRRMLVRLVRNLLDNANRHGGGKDVRVSLDAAAGQVTVGVEDRGPGVPEIDRERIFEPFVRQPRPDGDRGIGLGLSLVRQIARYHGGSVHHEPREGGGSRFVVRIQTGPSLGETRP